MIQSKKADFILCADLHLREDTPICRKDNYWEAQWRKVDWLKALKEEHKCPILCSGDVFDNWDISPKLAAQAIRHLPIMTAIPGQHDLPNHNIELQEKSGIAVLEAADVVKLYDYDDPIPNYSSSIILFSFPFGSKLQEISSKAILHNKLQMDGKAKYVALIHTLVLGPKDKNLPGATAKEIYKQMQGFNLIVCGDNHQSFVIEEKGRLLVSPGSMMRMTADQIDHKPCVYLWFAETNTVEPVYYSIEDGVITREHIEIKKEENKRINDFTQRLQSGKIQGISFEKNMEKYIQSNNVDKEVEQDIFEAIEKKE